MNSRTIVVTLRSSQRDVFGYLSDSRNLPRWATEFCKELKIVDGKTKVITCDPSEGELYFKIESDQKTGVIDMMAGPNEDQLTTFPARVISLKEGFSIFLFTMFQPEGMKNEKFDAQYRSFLIEADNLQRIFGS